MCCSELGTEAQRIPGLATGGPWSTGCRRLSTQASSWSGWVLPRQPANLLPGLLKLDSPTFIESVQTGTLSGNALGSENHVSFFKIIFLILIGCTMQHVELPQPGTELVPPAAEAQSLNHWTAREVLEIMFPNELLLCILPSHLQNGENKHLLPHRVSVRTERAALYNIRRPERGGISQVLFIHVSPS